MGTNGTNCSSSGILVDQSDVPLGYLDDFTTAPFMIAGTVLQDLLTDENTDMESPSHLESDLNGYGIDGMNPRLNEKHKTKESSLSGGIPFEIDSDEISSEEEPSVVQKIQAMMFNPAVKAAFDINKSDREELVANRIKLNDINSFLIRKGFKFEEVLDDIKKNGGSKGPTLHRDEHGLPFFVKKIDVPLKSILKPARGAPSNMDAGVSGEKNDNGVERGNIDSKKEKEKAHETVNSSSPVKPKSWADVVQAKKQVKVSSPVLFDFKPPPVGTLVVDPPDSVLQFGLEKMKTCITGHFSRGTIPFHLVNSEASKAWKTRGLLKVSQKDDRTFVFRFNSLEEKNSVLARGTWYFSRKPMVVVDCSPDTVKNNKVTKMPVWIKLSNIPDCYWTRELLSLLASVVGRPLFADSLTSQLDILPFARFCVEYTMGAPLPDFIDAMVPDSCSGGKKLVKVAVHYQAKPQSCLSCKSLGHHDSICPYKKVWSAKGDGSVQIGADEQSKEKTTIPEPINNIIPAVTVIPSHGETDIKEDEVGWQTVTKEKGSQVNSDSPSPAATFKSLKRVDEVDSINEKGPSKTKRRLTKSEKKKLRGKAGIASPVNN